VTAGAGLAPVEVVLQVFQGKLQAGGQPSTMATNAGPWLSPAVVTVNSLP
jgi:hypothetical protein